MYTIGVCNIATKLFLMLTDPAALQPPLGQFQGWNARCDSTVLFHVLPRDADQPDAEQLAYDLEHDYKGTGVETIVVCPKQPIEKIVALMDPSEYIPYCNFKC